MRALTAIMTGLALASTVAAQDIPQELKKDAAKAFAEGKTYFIWTPKADAIQGASVMRQSVAAVSIKVAARFPTNTPAFRVSGEIVAINRDNNSLTQNTSTIPDRSKKGFGYKRPGTSYPMIFATKDGVLLKGKGTLSVRLVTADSEITNTNAISNTLALDVEFKKEYY